MKNPLEINLLTVFLILLFLFSVNVETSPQTISKDSEFAKLTASELVNRLVMDSPFHDRRVYHEMVRRAKYASPSDRSQIISAYLSIVNDTSQPSEHRWNAISDLTIVVGAKQPIVADSLIAIAMNNNEELTLRKSAIRALPQVARNQKVLSALIKILNTTKTRGGFDCDIMRFKGRTFVAIGMCGKIGTDILLESFDGLGSTYGFNVIEALGHTGDTRALDFLISLLNEVDMKERYCGAILNALKLLGQHFQGDYFLEPHGQPDPISLSKVRFALESALNIDHRPDVIKFAGICLTHITPKGDLVTISRLRSFLPYLNPSQHNELEAYIKRLEPSETIVTPPIDVPLMDRVPTPPTRSR